MSPDPPKQRTAANFTAAVVDLSRQAIDQSRELLRRTADLISPPYRQKPDKPKRQPPPDEPG